MFDNAMRLNVTLQLKRSLLYVSSLAFVFFVLLKVSPQLTVSKNCRKEMIASLSFLDVTCKRKKKWNVHTCKGRSDFFSVGFYIFAED